MAQDNQIAGYSTADSEVELDFFILLRYLRESWRFVLIVMAVVAALTAYKLRNTSPTYQASMVVAPMAAEAGGGTGTSNTGIQSLTSVLSSLGGGGASSPQFDQFQYKMTSPSVVRAANADGQLYAWIYPGLWNAKTRSWIKPSGVGQLVIGLVRRFFHKPDWTPPDDVMTAQILSKQIIFETVPKSTLTLVTYQNPDRRIAMAMLKRLFSEADRQIRDEERHRLNAEIANANDMLAATQVSDLRMAMAQQLAQSEYRLMNVPDNIDYSARVVETPFVGTLPVAPKIGLSLALAVASALVFSAFVAVAYRISATELERRNGWKAGAWGTFWRKRAWRGL